MSAVVEDAPLAVCDARSVQKTDLEACDTIQTSHLGEGNYVYSNKNHRWYWLSHQKCDEPLLFVTWDSRGDPQSTGTSHSHHPFFSQKNSFSSLTELSMPSSRIIQ